MRYILLLICLISSAWAQNAKLVYQNKETKVELVGKLVSGELLEISGKPKSLSIYNLQMDFNHEEKSLDQLSEDLQFIGTITLHPEINDEKGNPVLEKKYKIEIIPRGMTFAEAIMSENLFGTEVLCKQTVKDNKEKNDITRIFNCEIDKQNSFSFIFGLKEK